MDNPLLLSWIVAGAGLLLLFLALAFLYGLMTLMTALVRDRPGEEKGEQEARRQEAMLRRAAAIGVALARAEQETGLIPAPEKEITSPWWTFHHHRQLTSNRHTGRIR